MKRELFGKLQALVADLDSRETLIVEGARQVGKSYLVNDVLAATDLPSISFDLEKDIRFRRDIDKTVDFNDFLALLQDKYQAGKAKILFIDEAQESKQLASYVKSFKENWPEMKVVLTGSSMNRFFSKDVRIPVGRTKSLCVFSFNFSEFIQYIHGSDLADFLRSAPVKIPPSRHRFLLENFDTYMLTGGYPESVIAHKAGGNYFDIIDEILASLEEDFSRKETYQPELFSEIIKGVANNIGSPSKYTHFETTKYYARQLIHAMRSWHIILEVEQNSLDPLRSHFLPKRYLHDLGVINRRRSMVIPKISILSSISPILRTPLGGIFENAVLLGLLAGESAKHRVETWKKGDSKIEVDFILDLPELRMKVPIESKAALQIKKRHYKNICHYLQLTGQKVGVVVSAAPFQVIRLDDGVIVLNIPVYLASRRNIEEYCRML